MRSFVTSGLCVSVCRCFVRLGAVYPASSTCLTSVTGGKPSVRQSRAASSHSCRMYPHSHHSSSSLQQRLSTSSSQTRWPICPVNIHLALNTPNTKCTFLRNGLLQTWMYVLLCWQVSFRRMVYFFFFFFFFFFFNGVGNHWGLNACHVHYAVFPLPLF